MDNELVLETYSSAAVNELQNIIISLTVRLFEYQTETDLLN